MIKVVIASNNKNKIRQFGEMFEDAGVTAELLTAGSIGFSEYPPEDADSFIGNSKIKAVAVRKFLEEKGIEKDYYVMADDSGLSVDALGGEPGVYSARYSGENATDEENNQKLLKILKERKIENRAAHYSCVITGITPSGEILHSEGRVEGRIIDEPSGHDGFGYDPYFFVDSKNMTFASLDIASRNEISHRGQAVRKMIKMFGL